MKSIDELNAFATSEALGGTKLPHSLSHPVLREVDGKVCVCYFVYIYNRDALDTGLYNRPAEWIALDIGEGTLVGRFSCLENDFTPAPYDEKYSIDMDETGRQQDAENHTKMRQLFDEARASVIDTGTLNEATYSKYLDKLLEITPSDFRVFYRDLSL